jgi:exonuclease III
MNEEDLVFLIWNVRGLNDDDRRTTVSSIISSSSCHIACLQESKLHDVDAATAAFVGGYRLKGFAQRPASGPSGTRGGILVLWDENIVQATDVTIGVFCISMTITHIANNTSFRLTSVYGPTKHNQKEQFFSELLAHKPTADTRWVANGDFNQIYRVRDKNKPSSNRTRINRFRATLQQCELNEIHLQNRRFTWSNERENPTMSKLDYIFCNAEWDIDTSPTYR